LRQRFNRRRRISVRANAERILPVDFEQVGGLIEKRRDGLVVHALGIRLNELQQES
jgi:hypothetical protein